MEEPKTFPSSNQRRSAILVGVQLRGIPPWQVSDNLDELEQLADTAGASVVCRAIQQRDRPDPGTFLGRGKVDRLVILCEQYNADLIIFDDDLTPAQNRNLEQALHRRVIDRSALILDIFASRARTRESRIQVELAQLEYMLPRLTRRWPHLSRQEGGLGGARRGPGETQLEYDRRAVSHRISHLKRQLDRIESARRMRRARRAGLFQVALIGYTNAGKSTLLNALAKSNVFVEDRLFATLDPAVRALKMDNGEKVLLIDTVGFIRKLPIGLVASFRSTLEESQAADLFVNVVDLAHPHWEGQLAQVEQILRELDLNTTPQILAFNKVDMVHDHRLLEGLARQYPSALFISALRGIRLNELVARIRRFTSRHWVRGQRAFTPLESDEIRQFEETVDVIGRSYREGYIYIDYLTETPP